MSPPRTVGPTGWSRYLEGGDDAEVAPAAPDAPEEVLVLCRADLAELAVGRDQIGRQEVVAGQAEATHQVAEAAA